MVYTWPWSSLRNPTHLNCSFGLLPVKWGPLRRPFRPRFETPTLPTDPVPMGVSLREVASEIEAEPILKFELSKKCSTCHLGKLSAR